MPPSLIYNVLKGVRTLKYSLVRNSILNVLRKNLRLDLLLVFTICGLVLVSLIPPQILKHVIDYNLVPKNSDRLLYFALAYLGAFFLIGVFNSLLHVIFFVKGFNHLNII